MTNAKTSTSLQTNTALTLVFKKLRHKPTTDSLDPNDTRTEEKKTLMNFIFRYFVVSESLSKFFF